MCNSTSGVSHSPGLLRDRRAGDSSDPGSPHSPAPQEGARTPLAHLACRQTSSWLPGVTLYHKEQRHGVGALPPPAALRSPANDRPGRWAKICPVLPGGEQMTNAEEDWVRSRRRSCVRRGQLAQHPNSGWVRTRPEPNTRPHLALLTESQRSTHQGRWPPNGHPPTRGEEP